MMDLGGRSHDEQPRQKQSVLRPYERPGIDPGAATEICTSCLHRRFDDLRGPYCPVCISIDAKVAKCRACADYHRRGKKCGCKADPAVSL